MMELFKSWVNGLSGTGKDLFFFAIISMAIIGSLFVWIYCTLSMWRSWYETRKTYLDWKDARDRDVEQKKGAL